MSILDAGWLKASAFTQPILRSRGGVMTTNALPVSPRLLALSEKLASDNSAVLTTFWSDVLAQGTPLLEPLPDDATYLLVTFLWRAPDPATQVAVIGDLTQRSPQLL